MRPQPWEKKLKTALADLQVITNWKCEYDSDTHIVKIDRNLAKIAGKPTKPLPEDDDI
jgi:hypothetical protein